MKKIVIRICFFSTLLLFSAGLTFSLLHVVSPRHLVAAPRVIVSNNLIPKKIAAPETIYSPPVRLEIPKISVSAPVVPVGLTSDNAMDIGQDITKTAWYKFGPKPGEKGSAVIAGHYGWLNEQGAIFNNLHTLQPGDGITVYDEKGQAVNFVVREIRKYDLNSDASDVFKDTDQKAHLNLITCGGLWDYFHQTYSDRLIVFTDLETWIHGN